ncbi:GumC family protein [Rhabdaerophilum calidifontis]|uniref:GumC family protein n=1 Tax=Rhabdaerophilum calidifontis TaxID=2604328 RepID=UPI001408422F|nr:GumC family protein [Rhabdaerophilum calidifontis]
MIGIAEFGAILARRWRVIAGSTALTTGLALAYAFLATPQYVASTAIFVDPRNRASFQIEGTGTGAGYDPNLVDSQTLVIESDAVLRRVIETEKLAEDPEFGRGPAEPMANALRNLKQALKVKRPERTYVVEIQIRSREAQKAARIANAVARAYLSDGRDSKSETATREAGWLDTHLANLQGRLREAEGRVEAYKAENRIIGAEGRLVGEQQLSELNRGLVEAQRRMAEAKAGLDQVEALKKSGRPPDAMPEALRSATIDRLRGQIAEILRLEANARSTLGPRHPAAIEIREQLAETRRLLNEELNRIAEGARTAYQVARAHVAGLERQLDQLKAETTTTNAKLLRLRELERAVDAQKAVYEKFLRDKEQIARLTVDTPAGRVIEPAATPQARSFPNRPLILALGFAAGLFAGIGLALALETLAQGGIRLPARPLGSGLGRGRHRTETANPSTEPLAILPAILPAGRGRWLGREGHGQGAGIALDLVDRNPDSPYSRAMIRLAERIAPGLDPRRSTTLMVSGAGGAGSNPALAANLARALARRGLDVLLVDGTGGASGLAAMLAGRGEAITVEIGAARRRAWRLAHAGSGALLILDPAAAPPRGGGPGLRVGVILIDGPPLGSADLGRIDIARRIDGVIALLPAGADPRAPALAAALRAGYQDRLLGTVGQAA